MDFLTREVFDTAILLVIMIGSALAIVRFYRDMIRPLPGDPRYRRPLPDNTAPSDPTHTEGA
ncbi:MAG: hypothetical protein MUF87_03315 [Anaerolineae bacterium]|nr:hypothetical protein [Anaerolineae bacterium]